MLNMTFTVTYVDGQEKRVTTAPKDEVALERQFDVGIAQLVERGADGALSLAGIRLEHLYYLAWSALTRTKAEVRDFDSFLDVIEEIDLVDDEEEPVSDPTQSGPRPD